MSPRHQLCDTIFITDIKEEENKYQDATIPTGELREKKNKKTESRQAKVERN